MGLVTVNDSELMTAKHCHSDRASVVSDEESTVYNSQSSEPEVTTRDPHVASLLRMTGLTD